MYFALLNLFLCFLIFINADEKITNDVYDVIILGAGMTGISAATELYANGIENILIIEAQDYIGGRIKTIEFGTKNKVNVNIGTSWIYGACTTWYCDSDDPLIKEDNPIKLLAEYYDISYVHDDFNSENYYDFLDTNKQINFDKLWEYYINYANATECINAQYHDFEALESKQPDTLISFRDGLTACNWSQPSDKESRFVEWYEYDWEEGVSPDVTNILSFIWPLTLYGDENLYVNDINGFQGIIKAMIDEFSLDSKIKLNEPVTNINYENLDEITVTTAMGIYKSKYVIVTFSIGVLQSNLVIFNPVLPVWKTDAINVMKMSDYCVMYFEWPYDFWTNKSNFINTTYLFDNYTAESEQLIFIHDGLYGGYYAWAKNLNHEKYKYFVNKNIWQIDVTDERAIKVQIQPKEITVNEIKIKLLKYFKNVPEPLSVVISNWTFNVYTVGAWAHWSLKGKENDWNLIGKNVDNIYFSGDTTSSKHFALVSGAYLHGIDTAQQIVLGLKGKESENGLSVAVIGVIIALIVMFVICIVIIIVMFIKRKKMKGAVSFNKGTQNDKESNKIKQQVINMNPTDDLDENIDNAEDAVPLTENM